MELKRSLLILAFFISVLVSKNIFSLKFLAVVRAFEATQSADLSIATDSAEQATPTPTPTPTPDFCKDGPDDQNDENDDDCVDIPDDDDDDDDGDGDNDDDDDGDGGDDDGDDGDNDDDDGDGGGSGGPSTLAGAGTAMDMVALASLVSGIGFIAVGSQYGKKKTRKS